MVIGSTTFDLALWNALCCFFAVCYAYICVLGCLPTTGTTLYKQNGEKLWKHKYFCQFYATLW